MAEPTTEEALERLAFIEERFIRALHFAVEPSPLDGAAFAIVRSALLRTAAPGEPWFGRIESATEDLSFITVLHADGTLAFYDRRATAPGDVVGETRPCNNLLTSSRDGFHYCTLSKGHQGSHIDEGSTIKWAAFNPPAPTPTEPRGADAPDEELIAWVEGLVEYYDGLMVNEALDAGDTLTPSQASGYARRLRDYLVRSTQPEQPE